MCTHFLLIWNQFVHHISIIQCSNFSLYVLGFSKKGLGQAEQHSTLFVHISKCLYSAVQLPGANLVWFLLWLSWAVSIWRIMSGRGFVDFFVKFREKKFTGQYTTVFIEPDFAC
jgi:hypothetical protein